MPAYRDGKKWRSRFRAKDLHGRVKEINKRGFSTKREALEFEREYLLHVNFDMEMKLKDLFEIYYKDSKVRMKGGSVTAKKIIFDEHILDYLGEYRTNSITPLIIRRYQNHLLTKISVRTNKKLSYGYLKKIYAQLSALFNYAVNFHDLKENPCIKAGPIPVKKEEKMSFWTKEEFEKFSEVIKHKIVNYTAFNILFWTGIRIGELLALKLEDISFEENTININKTFVKIKGIEIISKPKTESSIRTINIPNKLKLMILEYTNSLYDLKKPDRIFPITSSAIRNDLVRLHEKAGVKKIRIHDLRHSHASFLINNNVNPLAISKRLGHSKVDVTLNTYAHLYPSTDKKMIEIIENNIN